MCRYRNAVGRMSPDKGVLRGRKAPRRIIVRPETAVVPHMVKSPCKAVGPIIRLAEIETQSLERTVSRLKGVSLQIALHDTVATSNVVDRAIVHVQGANIIAPD